MIRTSQPALYRVTYPDGIDATFGSAGADILTIHEFAVSVLTARVLQSRELKGRRRVRYVCTEARARPYPSYGHRVSNFGAIGQFSLNPLRP